MLSNERWCDKIEAYIYAKAWHKSSKRKGGRERDAGVPLPGRYADLSASNLKFSRLR